MMRENGFCAAAQNELCVILRPTPHVHCLQHVMRMIGIDKRYLVMTQFNERFVNCFSSFLAEAMDSIIAAQNKK